MYVFAPTALPCFKVFAAFCPSRRVVVPATPLTTAIPYTGASGSGRGGLLGGLVGGANGGRRTGHLGAVFGGSTEGEYTIASIDLHENQTNQILQANPPARAPRLIRSSVAARGFTSAPERLD